MPYANPAGGARRKNYAPVAVPNLTAGPGTANNAVVDVGAAFNQGTLNDNFADLTAKLNALLAECRKAGIIT